MKKKHRGRRPLESNLLKIRIDLFVEKYLIDAAGGIDKAKTICKEALRENYEKKINL